MTSLSIFGPLWINQSKFNKFRLSYMENRLTEYMYLELVLEKEINTLISALKNTATGFDEMNYMSLNISSEILVKPPTNICNLSLTQGSFQNQFHSLVQKWRPPCCLIITYPFLYCVFFQTFLKTKMMYNRVGTFLEIFKILHENQRFRKQIIYPFGNAFIHR